ncbi:ATP-binding cassette domain-containing protein [Streptomyces sp. NPDC101191]|uniref:ATP-binding cassette domain-containing protein n=1 Tax=Streptomyces sp. NPDC101191 TaxID=3366126 RepID=UPI00382182A5
METNPDEPHGAAVVADGFGLKGPRGWAFRGIGFEAEPGSLVAIEGPSGTGRTCLLLALTGRMKTQEGHAEVAGLPLPRRMAAVRRISALGPVPGVSDLDPAFTVAEHLRERALLQRRFDGSLKALLRRPAERSADARARIDEALAAAGLDLATLPKGDRTSVRDLERLEALRLSIALALIGRPRLLALDDTDLKLSDADRAEAWALLRSVAASGITVLAVCSEAPEDALRVSTATRTPVARTAATSAARAADGAPAEKSPARKGPAEAAEAPEATAATAATAATGAEATEPEATEPEPAAGDDTATTATTEKTAHTAHTDKTEKTAHTEKGEADALAEAGRA